MFRSPARLLTVPSMGGVGMFHFLSVRIFRFLISFGLPAVAALIGLAAAGTASAPDRRPNPPGGFGFYLLSLSWSPSFCQDASQRATVVGPQTQCRAAPVS